MFQASKQRLRALLDLVDDVLGDPPAPVEPHPHRRPVRLDIERRRGAVAPRMTHCLSPVRPPAQRHRRDDALR